MIGDIFVIKMRRFMSAP